MIEGDGILLIGRDVFLIDNDEAYVSKRGENRASSPDDDARFSSSDSPIFIVFFRGGKLTMENRNLPFETPREIFDHDWGEGDLRDEHQDVLPFLKVFLT